jgi:glycosidase
MSHLREFLRPTAPALVAWGLIASLLPRLVAAQDRSEPPPCPDYEFKIEIDNVKGPEWSQGLPLYEASLERHTKEGTITAFRKDLPRLKEMGTGIVWFMPLHPKGVLKAKGSSYCVRDHFGVNESLGTKADLKQLLDDIHDSGMYAILDVVAKYTSWDHPLITSHPEYYVHRDDGTIAYPANWTDVAALDYSKQGVREWACSYLEYWAAFGFDGFRVDCAHMFPDDFWAESIPRINKKHPGLFWLAESHKESHHDLFDITYDWTTVPYLWKVFWNELPATKLDSLLQTEKPHLEKGALIMRHAINHDTHGSWYPGRWYDVIGIENSRPRHGRGNIYDSYGEGMKVANVLFATLPGKYMIYNAQDANHRGRGKIEWGDESMYPFYRSLFKLHRNHPAVYKGSFYKLRTNVDDSVFAFAREFGNEKVLVFTNLSGENKTVQIESRIREQEWEDYFSGEKVRLLNDIELSPYGYIVYVSKN